MHHPLTTLLSAGSSLSHGPHHTSTAAWVRSHTATRVNIINFSFTVAQCGRYSPSRCHPSCCRSPEQRPAVLHRWASPLPWNELAPCHVYRTCVWLWMHSSSRSSSRGSWQCDIFHCATAESWCGTNRSGFAFLCVKVKVALLSGGVNGTKG